MPHRARLLVIGDLNLARLDVVGDILGAAAIDLAAGAESSAKDLLDGALQVLGHGLESHGLSDGDDLIEGDALGVLDVLLLLPVTRGLLEGLDDERRGGGDDGNLGLTVLDGQLDRDAEALPVAGGLGDIFTDLCEALALLPVAQVTASTYSWARDQADRSWGRARRRHRLHHQWRAGG